MTDNEVINIQANYGLDILSIQKGRDSHLALAKFRYFKTKYQNSISLNQLTLRKSLIKSKDIKKLRVLKKYQLINESKNFFYFRSEEKLYKKLVKESREVLNKVHKEYCHINAFNYTINSKHSESELRALSWSMLCLYAPTDIGQEKLSQYLNTTRQTINNNLKKQVFHKNKHRSLKIGEIEASQKRVIKNLFHEIKEKREDEAKIIIKKNKRTKKIEIFAILTNEYIKKDNLKVSIERTKKGEIKKSSKNSLIHLIKNGYVPSGIHPSSKEKTKNSKDSMLNMTFSEWKKNKSSNVRFLNVGNQKKKKVLWKYEYYNKLPSSVENSLNKVKGFVYLEELRRCSEKKVSNIVGKDNGIIQLPVRTRKLIKKKAS